MWLEGKIFKSPPSKNILRYLEKHKFSYQIIIENSKDYDYSNNVKIYITLKADEGEIKQIYKPTQNKKEIINIVKSILVHALCINPNYLMANESEKENDKEKKCPDWLEELIAETTTTTQLKEIYNNNIDNAKIYQYENDFVNKIKMKLEEINMFLEKKERIIEIERAPENTEEALDSKEGIIFSMDKDINIKEAEFKEIEKPIDLNKKQIIKSIEKILKQKYGEGFDPRDYFEENGIIPKKLTDLDENTLRQAYEELTGINKPYETNEFSE